jgi:plastocyanin
MRSGVYPVHFRRDGIMVVLVAALVSVGGLAVFAGPVAAQGSASSSGAGVSSASVSIRGYAFNPGNITVVLGVNNTVTWTNDDSVTHTVVALGGSFNATLPAHGTFTHTFTTAGVYDYHCTIHTFMRGAVIVLAGPTSVSTASATSSTTSSNTPAAVPEFPFGALTIVITTALVLASYLIVKRRKRS